MFKLINQTFPKSKLVIYANTSMNKIMIYLKYLTNSLKYTKTIISLDNFKLIKLSTWYKQIINNNKKTPLKLITIKLISSDVI